MPESKTEQKRFACSRLGRDVTITRDLLIHRNSGGETDARFKTGLSCDGCRVCGVAAAGYDWWRCVHPELGLTG